MGRPRDESTPWAPVVEAGAGWELRSRLVEVLEHAAALDDQEQLAAAAAQLLSDYRAVWVRERRWRNTDPLPPVLVHVAGEVIACREYRRSCPGYIVDQRQACARCGAELIRGRWAVFVTPGEPVAKHGTIAYPPRGRPNEMPCDAREQDH